MTTYNVHQKLPRSMAVVFAVVTSESATIGTMVVKLFVNFFHPHHARTFDARQQLCGCDDPSNAGVRWRCVCSDASECENSSSSAVAYCLTCAHPSFNNYNRIHPTSNIELSRMCLLSSGWLGPRTLRARSARGCNRLTCNRLGDESYSSDRRNHSRSPV